MGWYYTRQAAFTAATKALGSIGTGVDGSSAGNFRVPQGAQAITKITGLVTTDGGSVANAGIVFCLRFTGPGLVQGQQDLVLAAGHMGKGAGTITSTMAHSITPTVIPVMMPVKPGNDITLQGAYYGTDSGNQYVGVTLEFS